MADVTDNDAITLNVEAVKANGDAAAETTNRFDYDGYYKDLFECFFYPLLKRAIPELYAIADTAVKPRFLDKEFRDILNTGDPTIHTSPYFADYVVEVPTKDGGSEWILCHIEAQGRGGRKIAERMFHYMCLIYARYHRVPVGLVIITDGHKKEERFFSNSRFGVKTFYEYHSVVLADLDDKELQASDNPIDLAFYAAKCALRTSEELQKYTYLRQLTALLTERGWNANDKRNLLLFMRRIINLQDTALQEQYLEHTLEVSKEGKLVRDWFEEALAKRLEQQVREEVREEVREQVRAEGREEGTEKMVKNLLANGIAPDVIAQSADWPIERIRAFVN